MARTRATASTSSNTTDAQLVALAERMTALEATLKRFETALIRIMGQSMPPTVVPENEPAVAASAPTNTLHRKRASGATPRGANHIIAGLLEEQTAPRPRRRRNPREE